MRVYYSQPTPILRAVSKTRKPQMWMNFRAAEEGLEVPGCVSQVSRGLQTPGLISHRAPELATGECSVF